MSAYRKSDAVGEIGPRTVAEAREPSNDFVRPEATHSPDSVTDDEERGRHREFFEKGEGKLQVVMPSVIERDRAGAFREIPARIESRDDLVQRQDFEGCFQALQVAAKGLWGYEHPRLDGLCYRAASRQDAVVHQDRGMPPIEAFKFPPARTEGPP